MARTNEVITNIRLKVDITSQQIKNLGEQSMETCKIVAVIDDIAAKTSEIDTSRDTDVKLRRA